MSGQAAEQIESVPAACRDAQTNHEDARKNVRRWSNYLLVAGAILLVLIAAAAFLFASSQAAQAALSTGAAIADGAALGWIVTRWLASEKNLRYWYGQVVKHCPAQLVEDPPPSLW